jgi:hypothetical protein
METQKDMADIIGTLTTMAQQLGLHVVAEGVENEEQLAVLRALRCESVQGYLFAKPLDVNKATDLLRTGLQPRGDGVGDQEPEAQRPDALLPEPQTSRSLSPSGRWFSIAAAALALATCAGLVAQFSNGFQPDVPSSSSLPPAIEEPGPRLGTVKDGRIPIRAADTAAGRAAAVAAASGTKPKQDRSAQSSPQPAGAGTSEVAATRLLGRAPGSPPEAPAVVVRPPASLKVVHLHRVGSCQGRLVVSRGGVAFVPDEKTEDDAFALKYTDFLPTLSDNTLTIKSNSRTYRFKAAAVAGKEDDGSRFHEVMEGIAHFR